MRESIEKTMDQQSHLSRNIEPGSLAVASVDKQTTETIESVANKLAIIGDDLNKSYELPYYNGVFSIKAKACTVLVDCWDIPVLLLKVSI